MNSLEILVVQAQAGNLDAFTTIINRFQDMAYANAYAVIGDFHLAQDAAQEAFIEAYFNLSKLQHPAAFSTWFKRVVFKQSERFIRRKSLPLVSTETALDLPTTMPGPVHTSEIRHLQTQMQSAIAALPEKQRQVTILFYLGGNSYQEISTALDLPLSTIKKRLYTARKTLKERLFIMAQDYLETQRPSQDTTFSDKIQLFLAMQTDDLVRVKTILGRNPALVNAHKDWGTAPKPKGYQNYFKFVFNNDLPLHWAARRGNVALVEALLAAGAEVNLQTQVATALKQAVELGHTAVVETLLQAGADPNLDAPLLSAVNKNYSQIAHLLLQKGAKLNETTPHGLTYLHWAAIKGHWAIISVLLAHGANKGLKDEQGRTALDWAKQNKHQNAIEELQHHGQTQDVIPVGPETLGRIMRPTGEVLDGLPALTNSPRWHIKRQANAQVDDTAPQVLPTGIKVIDLLAPLRLGGKTSLFATQTGSGKIVQLGELIRRLALHNGTRTVFLSAEVISQEEVRDWLLQLLETDYREAMTLLMAASAESHAQQKYLAQAGLTLAEYWRDTAQCDVLLVIDTHHLPVTIIQSVQERLGAKANHRISILFYGDDDKAKAMPIDTSISFDSNRAKQGLYPAFNLTQLRSSLLTPEVVGQAHVNTAQETQDLLQAYQSLEAKYEAEGMAALSPSEQDIARRARRLSRFLTQPFFVAEQYTGRPAEFVPLAETIKACQEILSGQHNQVPEEAFMFSGTMEQVLAQAKRQA